MPMFIKATPYPVYEVYKALEPHFDLFAREESRWSLAYSDAFGRRFRQHAATRSEIIRPGA